MSLVLKDSITLQKMEMVSRFEEEIGEFTSCNIKAEYSKEHCGILLEGEFFVAKEHVGHSEKYTMKHVLFGENGPSYKITKCNEFITYMKYVN